MKKLMGAGFLLLTIACPSTVGQSPNKAVQELSEAVTHAYKAKTLADLDKNRMSNGTVTLVIEHSLMEGKNGNGLIKVKQFKNLAAIDRWLKGQEREEGAPFRQIMPLLKCNRGRCTYDFNGGILHNQLYLHDLYYGFRNGRPYVTKIRLLDGD